MFATGDFELSSETVRPIASQGQTKSHPRNAAFVVALASVEGLEHRLPFSRCHARACVLDREFDLAVINHAS